MDLNKHAPALGSSLICHMKIRAPEVRGIASAERTESDRYTGVHCQLPQPGGVVL